MYSQVNLAVNPSKILSTAMYLVLSTVLAAVIIQFLSIPTYLKPYSLESTLLSFAQFSPVLIVLFIYAWKLGKKAFVFQRSRQWLINNGKLQFVDHKGEHSVELVQCQIWYYLVLFQYRSKGKNHWEVICKDAVVNEDFRKFRCMLKLKPQI